MSIIIHLPFYYPYQKQQKTTDPLLLCFPSPSIFSWRLPWVWSVQSSQKSNGPLWCTAFHSVTSMHLLCQRYSPELVKEQQRAHKGDNLSFSQTHSWKQLIFPFIHPESGCGSYLPVNQTEWRTLPFKVNLLKKRRSSSIFKLCFFPSSLGVLDVPVIMAITGEWDFCLPFILLLEHLCQVFELCLQANPLSCCASTALAGVQLSKGWCPQRV